MEIFVDSKKFLLIQQNIFLGVSAQTFRRWLQQHDDYASNSCTLYIYYYLYYNAKTITFIHVFNDKFIHTNTSRHILNKPEFCLEHHDCSIAVCSKGKKSCSHSPFHTSYQLITFSASGSICWSLLDHIKGVFDCARYISVVLRHAVLLQTCFYKALH